MIFKMGGILWQRAALYGYLDQEGNYPQRKNRAAGESEIEGFCP
jgi:hypothetical protein